MTHDPFVPPAAATSPDARPAARSPYTAPLDKQPPPRSAAGLGVAAIVLACALTAIQVTQVFLAPQGAAALRAAAEVGLPAYQSEWSGYDAVNLLHGAVQLACYIVTCAWLYRSRSIAVATNPHFIHVRGKVWTWLGWWVPIVVFWFPYQVVRDIRSATAKAPVSGIGWWWALWLVYYCASTTATRVGTRLTPEATAQGADVLVNAEILATCAMIPALVLWIWIIRDVTHAQTRLRVQAERIAAAQSTTR